jgi:hypothetical protein
LIQNQNPATKELENKIQKNNLWKTIDKLLFGRAHYSDWDYYDDKLHDRKILREIEKEIREEIG